MKLKTLTNGHLSSPNATENEQEITKTSNEITQLIADYAEEETEVTQTMTEFTQPLSETLDTAPLEEQTDPVNGLALSSAEVMENFARSLWKKVRINLDHLFIKKGQRSRRVPCGGQVVFTNWEGKKIAVGNVTDLSEKSGGFIVEMVYVNVNDVLYLEFIKSKHFHLAQVKVTVKRVQEWGARMKIGVEFADASVVFQKKLAQFLGEWRADSGFNDIDSRW